jgi:hypothetical protein
MNQPRPTDWSPAILDEPALLRQCRWEAFRGSGPGGQKRNKTSSSVRLVHKPSGLSAVAGEARSQAVNRATALLRLRRRMVLELRAAVDPRTFVTPPDVSAILRLTRRAAGSPDHLRALGVALDVLAASGCSVSAAARLLGVSTGQLVGFLRADPRAWATVNRMRTRAGLRPLVGR